MEAEAHLLAFQEWDNNESLNLRSKISGACFWIMVMMMQRTVASDIGVPAVCILMGCVMIPFTSLGYST
jgi:hypothetical protein